MGEVNNSNTFLCKTEEIWSDEVYNAACKGQFQDLILKLEPNPFDEIIELKDIKVENDLDDKILKVEASDKSAGKILS